MKRNILTISFIFLFISFSCNDLSENVYSELTEQGYNYSPGEISNILGPVYQNMRGFSSHVNLAIIQETTSDILVMPANASGWDDGGIYKKMHLHTWDSEALQVSQLWSVLYRGVLHANRIINQLATDAVPVPAGVSRDALIAEVKVARAFYYWLLIDNFGDVPFVTTISQDLPSKESRKVIYDAIVADLNESKDKLSAENNKEMYGRFNKWGAKALLANIYLNSQAYTGTAEWDKCLAECNDIITSAKYQLETNYADCFKAQNHNSVETIFAIPYDEVNGTGLYINHILHASSRLKYNLRTTPWGAGSAKGISQFIDTYDHEDGRIDATWDHGPQFAADGVTPLLCVYDRAGQQINYSKDLPDGLYTAEDEGYRLMKYRPETNAATHMNNDVPFFRYSQVLMMKAECLLRKGQSGEAAAIVTQVRQRAFKNNPSKATVTGAMLTANSKYDYGYVENYVIVNKGNSDPVQFGGFYDELGYEFAGEWMRRRDMIRFGIYTTKSWLSHKPQGNKTKVFPIPQSVIDSNPNLDQNPDYQ